MKALRKNYLPVFGFQLSSRFSTSKDLRQQNEFNKTKTTIDSECVTYFSKHVDGWWDRHGEVGPLHSMNSLRVQLIRDGLTNTGFKVTNPSRPLEGIKLLDVGCGGGILSEPLARIGANVTGLDATKELITIAKEHAALDKDLSSNLNYVHTSIEDYSQEKKEEYDVVVASEILEHVINQELFLKSCIEVLKPNGSIFITTLNKNIISWFGGIVAAEYLLKLVPLGTHDWNKFISPEETRKLLEKCNCKTKLVHGMFYNFLTKQWSWTSTTAINYALHAVKKEAIKSDH